MSQRLCRLVVLFAHVAAQPSISSLSFCSLKFPSTTKNQLAQLYYTYGKFAATGDPDVGYPLMSLQDMTDTAEAKWSPYFNDYLEYYQRNKFDDSAVMAAFEDTDGVLNSYPDQRRAFIVSLLRYNVVPEYMMSVLGLTLEICQDKENTDSPTLYWDAFAALYIGSLEGIDDGGSDADGLLTWSIANNRARQFNTQNDNFLAEINEEGVDLFFAGQSELERKDCVNFVKTASRVLHLLILPSIQSTIWYAIRNERLPTGSTDKDLAIGEAAAFSVLPIVAKYDKTSAAVIERNMIRQEGVKPVYEGPQVVANAFYQILDDLGWGCEYIGQADGVDTCELYEGSVISGSTPKPAAVAIFVCLASLMWEIILIP